MAHGSLFRQNLREAFAAFIAQQAKRFPQSETVKIDLHCHDRNSDVPDELVGRLLRSRETWVRTEEVAQRVRSAGCDLVTITNHNNARSCWTLLEKGVDVLPGAEFTCRDRVLDLSLHVLAYGFSPEEEALLLQRRGHLEAFLDTARERDIPLVLAHPLFVNKRNSAPPAAALERWSLMFDSFEVVNGQRDSWQSLLVAAWLDRLDEERLHDLSRRHGIAVDRFCRNPFHKSMCGGSDEHMAMFVGSTGTRVHVPRLGLRRSGEKLSAMVLEGLRKGATAPFGRYTDISRLTASFLDFFCQAAINLKDPGLVRLLLHQGTATEKLLALGIANGLLELRRHKFTYKFVSTAHDALHGRRPSFITRRGASEPARAIVKLFDGIAQSHGMASELYEGEIREALPEMSNLLCAELSHRVIGKFRDHGPTPGVSARDVIAGLDKLELPANLRALFGGDDGEDDALSLTKLTDGLPFPALALLLLMGASFAATRVMFSSRGMLDEVAKRLNQHRHPRRALWLTDTLFDRNGVATALQQIYAEVVRRDLPIDFAYVGDQDANGPHLVRLKQAADFETPIYQNQRIRLFDPNELSTVFLEGGYDRVICSTEAPMGLMALYLKQAFNVPAYFYLHTDWIDFARRTLFLSERNMDRLRRLLRFFYREFDGLCVLNTEQMGWLASKGMDLDPDRLHLTAHWANEEFHPWPVRREEILPGIEHDDLVVLYAGRLSEEKGVLELRELMEELRERFDNVKLVLAGVGPAEERLRSDLPDAVFLGWVAQEPLARICSACDVLVLPSKFDTFGCVVLEAMSCGLPVVSYAAKGPKDIIEHDRSGLLATDRFELAEHVAALLANAQRRHDMRIEARRRASTYDKSRILDGLVAFVGLQ
ncbi:MAG: glycosyltransferase [Myxococcota bacterium]|jgi:glycosyltransferase involved in cell wall biosynthesis|nr:glycosyltransferase [Myxococcota bacterium]